MKKEFDQIIVGGGSMGAATAYYLAKRGQKVLLLEQFGFIHENGAHTGQTRLIRKAYFEHPDYVPLLQKAYQNWVDLEAETREKLYFETGILYFGEPRDALIGGVKTSANLYNLKLDILNLADAKQKYPMFGGVPDDWESVFEPEAGFLLVEKCIQTYLQQALKYGATLKAHERVTDWQETENGVEVVTEKGLYFAKKVVFTAGAWTDKLLRDLGVPLVVTRQISGWVKPAVWEDFTLKNFVCWCINHPENGLYYGMPILEGEDTSGPIGLKLGCHRHGETVNPDAVNRQISAADEATFRYCLDHFMSAANGDILSVKTCLYTNSPDENFIIDCHPKHLNVVFACGFSGHGFKFASVVGEILADLALFGETSLPVGFLGLDRFDF